MIVKIAVATAGLLGLGVGLTIPAFLPVALADPTAVNVVCKSFEGPQGPAGANGKDGLHSTFTFKHDPELLGLFSEQNVKIETQPVD